MVSKYMKRCSTSLAIRKMPTETTVRCHFILTRIAIIKKTSFFPDVEKLESSYTAENCKMVQVLKKSLAILQNTKYSYHMTQQFHTYVYTKEKNKCLYKKQCMRGWGFTSVAERFA